MVRRRAPSTVHQRGFAVLAVAVVIVMIAAAVVIGWSSSVSVGQSVEQDRLQREYLAEVRARLADWYRRELAQIDAVIAAPDPEQVLRGAGIHPRWRLRLQVSDRLQRDGVAHRVLAAWLPGEGDTSSLDIATGVFAPSAGARWVAVSGFELQSMAIAETRARMERLAAQLEVGYRVRYFADPSRDATVNRFRAADCAAPGNDRFPCIDSYQPIASTPLAVLAGLEPQLGFNAWGGAIEVSNRLDSSLTVPYSMALRTSTPWGDALTMVAVAPL